METNHLTTLDATALSHVIGGDSYNPGTQNWVNGMGQPSGGNSGGGDSGWGDALGKKIAECIAYGVSGRRGPFGCNS
ncbi:hypothetical protein [Lacticaseibacillus paracasei]|uniref:hypothetical protein n=1 Tax=Lacticaseibacillus paracasei TaxID=1597 RepID=UPI001891BF90|nr:hypothetical protein [Lacticaseibacillus paracasei]QPB55683.1 hypothetical protein GFB64_00310 [Lacticaseibacillus paracasei]WPQ30761.1 hypothetical protein SH597_00290 [Lacticaseibacillus paracasei]